MASNSSWWGKKRGKAKPKAKTSLSLQELLRRWGKRLGLEHLEDRITPAVDLNYDWLSDHLPISGANLALKVADHTGHSWLQIVDTDTSLVAQEPELTDDVNVHVDGGPLSDTLTIDLPYS